MHVGVARDPDTDKQVKGQIMNPADGRTAGGIKKRHNACQAG